MSDTSAAPAVPLEQSRLLSIIEYAQQSAKMKATPAIQVAAHDFHVWENDAQARVGVSINPDAAAAEDDRWLVIKRLQQSSPPAVKNALLKPWVELSQGPYVQPKLKQATRGQDLVEAGTHHSISAREQSGLALGDTSIAPDVVVELARYPGALQVQAEFKAYESCDWRPWSEHEKAVRETITLYSKLFTLKQQFEDGIVERALELVWGVGIGVWETDGAKLCYPLLTRLVELNLDEKSGAIEIRPRDAQARIELDWYASVDNPGVAAVDQAGKEFFERATQTLSPFDRGSFEPLLRTAVTHLDPQGTYQPDHVSPDDRSVPKPQNHLVVTDSWVLFARPRSANLFIQDLEKFKAQLHEREQLALPDALAAVVTDPATTSQTRDLPTFRGVSAIGVAATDGSRDAHGGSARPQDLFFPKPFNDEQVRIVQLLEISEGVVVQGPPGTGKTHTIANVICHYLANGKRVLVTSMKDPALAVLREQLPEDIRPLAISLLSTELDGMKQFEHAIHTIAAGVQSLDQAATAREIAQLETTIDTLHGKLTRVDYEVGHWAKVNLEAIEIDGEHIDPQDAARAVVEGEGQYEWLLDKLEPSAEFAPRLTNDDVVKLRDARRTLGNDLSYLGAVIPSHAELPKTESLLQAHEALSRLDEHHRSLQSGDLLQLRGKTEDIFRTAATVIDEIESLEKKRAELAAASVSWIPKVRMQLLRDEQADLFHLLRDLSAELNNEKERQKIFLMRPVALPANFDADPELVSAVSNLGQGRSAFGIIGGLGKASKKQLLKQVRVLDEGDVHTPDAWQHVGQYLEHRRSLRQLTARWNALASQIGLDTLTLTEPEDAFGALSQFRLFELVEDIVACEKMIASQAAKLLLNSTLPLEVHSDPKAARRLAHVLQQHISAEQLKSAWSVKEEFERCLEGRCGPVVSEIRRFLRESVGNPAIDAARAQSEWAALIAELARVQALSPALTIVEEVSSRIAASGAPLWAQQCRVPRVQVVDATLPDNWRTAWRLRRLANYLERVDARHVLQKLATERAQIVHDLAKAYQQCVSQRTWLKLAQKAVPSIRAALAAYLTAIQKIGKGTGKRAVRYRKDARDAAAAANPAVPCWIMPHYRISESLPAEFGCFDLVIIDEASQSDLTALPALLRAKKVLIVGDDKQVSPEGVGLEEQKVRHLMTRYLQDQVETYRPQFSPERSLYDLFKVVFAQNAVMLKEHFRCVPAIIEYSKREFYNHELRPLRLPRTSERLDPPLVDVLVEDGFRSGELNRPEAQFIVHEVQKLVADPRMAERTIGVVSLLGDKQAMHIWELLTQVLGPDLLRRHRIACGDARTFQGKERHVMFLSMVCAPNERGAPLSRDSFAQRFNVAASRAQDRMYLVRSVELDQLSERDILRRGLITHFSMPFFQDAETVADLRAQCESPFEREIYDELTLRGFRVTPQVKIGHYRIDLVVEGANDERLAIECDGDRYHGADKWTDDMHRQRVLERAGWVFWRCFASTFVRDRDAIVADLLNTLAARGIEAARAEGEVRSIHTEMRRVRAGELPLSASSEPPCDESARHSLEITTVPADVPAEPDRHDPRQVASAQQEVVELPQEELSLTDVAVQAAAVVERAREQSRNKGAAMAADEQALRLFLDKNGLKSEDNRAKGGALWIHLDERRSAAAEQLARWHFSYKRGRGWWKR